MRILCTELLLFLCSVSLGKFLHVSETPSKANSNCHREGWLCARQCPEKCTGIDAFTLYSNSVIHPVTTLFPHTRKMRHREAK